MKTNFVILLLCFASSIAMAQAPSAIPYQAVARNAGGLPIMNQSISVRISILDLTVGGSILFRETFITNTNQFGLFNINIGTGTLVSGSFSTIPWGTGAKFIEVEFDPAGGSAFTSMGTQQLMSAPYALYANSTKTTINTFAGIVQSMAGSSSTYVFAGPPVTITLTSTKRITGAATAPLGLAAGSATQTLQYGLCWQPLAGGTIINFAGFNYTNSQITTTRANFSASNSTTLGPGTYKIGFGVVNSGTAAISNTDYVNGWVMITEP